ncbi:MAG: 50S ribosomal protein L24 [Nanoarchaeota archaeon]
MTPKKFSTHWKSSVQPRKQHKFRHNAPLHVRQKLVHIHLSPELRKKYGTRAAQAHKGDRVKVLRGKFKKQEGKIEKVDLKRERIFIAGLEYTKKNGNKVPISFRPSNLMITVLEMADKRRKLGKEKIKEKIKSKSSEESKK